MSATVPLSPEVWERTPHEARDLILRLLSQLGHLQKAQAGLSARVDELSQRLNQNSTNSSKPPSSDGPHVKRAPPKPKGRRKKGGQQGHLKAQRPLLEPDQLTDCKPHACRRCGRPLRGDDPKPWVHQVLELPKIKPQVHHYRRHRLTCPCCGTATCGELPEGVPQGGQGPRLEAAVCLLTGQYRTSKQQAADLLGDLCGVPLSPGQVCATEEVVSRRLEPVVGEVQEHVRVQHANVDETGFQVADRKAWLWVAVTRLCVLFAIRLSRGACVALEILGQHYLCVLTSDRFKAYDGLEARRQLCWAHLRRDFQAMIDRHNQGSAIGTGLLGVSDELFEQWYRVRDGTLSRPGFRLVVCRLRRRLKRLLRRGAVCGCAKTEGTCQDLLAKEVWLWTFAAVEGVEPTNNAAERALRPAVVWRKANGRVDSAKGARYLERIWTVVGTLRQQGRNVLDFLTACNQAALEGLPMPSLLPTAHA